MNKKMTNEFIVKWSKHDSSHSFAYNIKQKNKLKEELNTLLQQAKDEDRKRIFKELPQNPYPKEVFPMTTKDYVKAIPDEKLRGAISGYMGRWVWDNCIKSIKEAIRED